MDVLHPSRAILAAQAADHAREARPASPKFSLAYQNMNFIASWSSRGVFAMLLTTPAVP